MNALTAYQFESNLAHGAFVELELGVADLLEHRGYPPDVERLIGEAMAAMPLLATHLRFEGRINLQFQGDAAVKLLVAQVDHRLQVRGMAKVTGEPAGDFQSLLGSGLLALMIEPDGEGTPSQALVPIEGASLAAALEGYFERSEQLPTRICLAADGNRLRGFLLQRLPLVHAQGDEDDWDRLALLADTLAPDELLTVDAETLVRRLFGGEDLHLFPPRPVAVACRCSREGIGRMLVSLGSEEVSSIIAEQGKVEVTCEFCGRDYRFDQAETDALFASAEIRAGAQLH